ncbi:hypothetical protein JQ604_17860 [Bradyrhizobium jicamae]|uniref:hypothetical protein n=1 Tax=Bradyrhizobium jicamae TaxID=280332 RepID=UPI001BA551EE|nr:hypothetical protein [Bradyrhizobium jicamae]MBR0754053.1 hypothetical protein [Bradyrhizobium jicamae]
MESIAAYLDRKHEELRLLNEGLRTPLPVPRPQSVTEVVRQKFQLTAALKAEHTLHDWNATETDWSHAGQPHAGPFAFAYDYQRADLEVHGPSFYDLQESAGETVYTASGMAAIAALLLASADVIGKADIRVAAGSYGETLELIERHARHLRLVTLKHALDEVRAPTTSRQILLLDSCAPARGFEAALRGIMSPSLDLLIFDTTCFSAGSGRIRRVLRRARRREIPTVMVRSHTKLDSLGAEYGRLGSAVFVDWDHNATLKQLPVEMRNAVRLLGGAPLPAHFPPYIGTASYHALTSRRVAAMLRNSRRAIRYLASAIPGLTAELHFAHGLYLTLASTQPFDEASARRASAQMSDDLAKAGLPIRHAGSFGFDFAATEWFHNATTDRYSVRLAVPDLPTPLWEELTQAIAQWWLAHQREGVAA